MKVNNYNTYIYNKKNTFGALRKVKCTGLFDIHKNKDDFAAFYSIFLSDGFRYLIKNRDVSFLFDKYYRADEKRMATILHYEFKPVQTSKLPLIQRIQDAVKKYFLGDSELKKHWMEGWVNVETGEKRTLHQQIREYTVEKMKKLM